GQEAHAQFQLGQGVAGTGAGQPGPLDRAGRGQGGRRGRRRGRRRSRRVLGRDDGRRGRVGGGGGGGGGVHDRLAEDDGGRGGVGGVLTGVLVAVGVVAVVVDDRLRLGVVPGVGGARTLVGAARTLVRGARTLVGAARTLVRGARTLVGAARTLVGAARTLVGAARTLVGAARARVRRAGRAVGERGGVGVLAVTRVRLDAHGSRPDGVGAAEGHREGSAGGGEVELDAGAEGAVAAGNVAGLEDVGRRTGRHHVGEDAGAEPDGDVRQAVRAPTERVGPHERRRRRARSRRSQGGAGRFARGEGGGGRRGHDGYGGQGAREMDLRREWGRKDLRAPGSPLAPPAARRPHCGDGDLRF